MREILEEHAGGMADGYRFRSLIPGCASTEFILEEHLDVNMDYDSLQKVGSHAVDAGGTDIRIEVLHGGKRLIAVSDNATGMDYEDALLCFERHATSKLAKEDDLFSIRTLGFRGEALPAIASVSKVRLVTAARGNHIGVSVELNGGIVGEIKESPALGTTVEVKDLFFNTPARKKFLKSTSIELYHIIDTVTKESLSHWGIGFSPLTDHKETLHTPPSSGPKERIMQIYGEAAALERFCLCFGGSAGDIALAHGAGAVVVAGGLGQRLAGRLVASGFAERFVAKGRFRPIMASIPVKLITHPQPGLLGAAAAFAWERRSS